MMNVGFWPRMMAYNIDFIYYLSIAFTLKMIFVQASYMYVSFFLLFIIFEALFILSKWSATPGKKYFGLKVKNANDQELTVIQAVLRPCFKIVSLLLFFTGFAMIALRRDKRALHDLICSTKVVFNEA
jgi:uncharacterized RDD family membrane protein YckC